MGNTSSDTWSYLDSREPGEARRMRHCRGCIYLGTAGNYANCDYFLKTDQRRGCPAGKGCTRKIIKDGYKFPDGYDEYLAECDRLDEADRIREQKEKERLQRVMERDKFRLNGLKQLDRKEDRRNEDHHEEGHAEEDRVEKDAYQYRQNRGRPRAWDAEYAKILFMTGRYYRFEIADILGIEKGILDDYIRLHGWMKLQKAGTLEQHNLTRELDRYKRYQRAMDQGVTVDERFLDHLFFDQVTGSERNNQPCDYVTDAGRNNVAGQKNNHCVMSSAGGVAVV